MWEYKTLFWLDSLNGINIYELNELGLMGWELCSVITLKTGGTLHYFKKPVN